MFGFYSLVLGCLALIVVFFVVLGGFVGEQLSQQRPLLGYAVNLTGSFAGIILFTLLSFWRTPPAVWLSVGFAMALTNTDDGVATGSHHNEYGLGWASWIDWPTRIEIPEECRASAFGSSGREGRDHAGAPATTFVNYPPQGYSVARQGFKCIGGCGGAEKQEQCCRTDSCE